MKRYLGLAAGFALVLSTTGCFYSPGYCDPCTGRYYCGGWEPYPGGPLDVWAWWPFCNHSCGNNCCGCDNCCSHNGCCPGACGMGPGYGQGGGWYPEFAAGPVYPMTTYDDSQSAIEEPVYRIPEDAIYSGEPIYPEGTPQENRAPLPEPAPASEKTSSNGKVYRSAPVQNVQHNPQRGPQRVAYTRPTTQWVPAR
jgi:hypothetical protein